MSNAQEQPWSNDPDAPKITHHLYASEKATLAGIFIGSILYGAHNTHYPLSVYPCSPCLTHSRVACCTVIQMYRRAAQPPLSQTGRYQVGACILHHRHVLVCDRVHRHEPQRSVHILHR